MDILYLLLLLLLFLNQSIIHSSLQVPDTHFSSLPYNEGLAAFSNP